MSDHCYPELSSLNTLQFSFHFTMILDFCFKDLSQNKNLLMTYES